MPRTDDPFWRDFFARADESLLLLIYTFTFGGFALGMEFLSSWLANAGWSAAAWTLGGAYVVVSLPILAAQLSAISDLVFLFVDGVGVSVPALCATADRGTGSRMMTHVIANMLIMLSPFSGMATFAWTVAVPSMGAWERARLRHRAEAQVMSRVLAKLAR
jgi:hypothetical protein